MENLQHKDVKLDKTEIRKLRVSYIKIYIYHINKIKSFYILQLEEQRLKTEKQRIQRLIKIAKPIDLPFTIQNQTSTEIQGQSEVKKQMPMIGKRNQFSKFKVVKVESKKPKDLKPAKAFGSDEEEMEEDDTPVGEKSIESKEMKVATDKIEIKTVNIENEEVVEKENEIKDEEEIKKNTSNCANKKQNNESEKLLADAKDEEVSNKTDKAQILPESVDHTVTETVNNSKKRRQRVRQRGKRQEVDIDDDEEYETSDKYAKWVPPENQTGDGFTELNKKFGY